jgi:hypothetical protein
VYIFRVDLNRRIIPMHRDAVKFLKADLTPAPPYLATTMSSESHNDDVRLQRACDEIAIRWRRFGLSPTEARAQAQKFRDRVELAELDAVLARVSDAMAPA